MSGDDHQDDAQPRAVINALDGNERVWYHPDKPRLAIWYGKHDVKIVNSQTFEKIDTLWLDTHDKSVEETELAVTVELTDRGYYRNPRSATKTKVVET